MRKSITAVAVGVLLIAGQAAATSASPVAARVGDRVGASTSGSNEFAGIPLMVLVMGTLILATAVVTALDDDSDSD